MKGFDYIRLVILSTTLAACHLSPLTMADDALLLPPEFASEEAVIEEIKQQIPNNVTYTSIKIDDVQEIENPFGASYQAKISVDTTLKNTLYKVTGQNSGKFQLEPTTSQGDKVTLHATAISMNMMGNSQLKVMLLPSSALAIGRPLSAFDEGTYEITATQPTKPHATTEQAHPIKQIDSSNSGIEAVSKLSIKQQQTHPTPKVAWNDIGNTHDYILLDQELWHIPTEKKVATLPHSDWSYPYRPIHDMPGHFWPAPPAEKLSKGIAAIQGGGATITDDPTQGLKPFSGLRQKYRLSSDRRQFIMLKDADLWHGTIDWRDGSIKGLRNATNIGLLHNVEPVAWHKSTVLLHNRDSFEKPYIFVDLKSGAITETEDHPTLKGSGSPDGRFLFSIVSLSEDNGNHYLGSTLAVYDMEKKEHFTMSTAYNPRSRVQNPNYTPKLLQQSSKSYTQAEYLPKTHSNEERFIPANQKLRFISQDSSIWVDQYIFQIPGFGWYDLQNRTRLLINDTAGIKSGVPYEPKNPSFRFIPGMDYVDADISGVSDDGDVLRKRYRINRHSGEAVELPAEHTNKYHPKGRNIVGLTWINPDNYVYAVIQGSLSEVGSWHYNVPTRTLKRITPFSPIFSDWSTPTRVESLLSISSSYTEQAPAYEPSAIAFVALANHKLAFVTKHGNEFSLNIYDVRDGLRSLPLEKPPKRIAQLHPHPIKLKQE